MVQPRSGLNLIVEGGEWKEVRKRGVRGETPSVEAAWGKGKQRRVVPFLRADSDSGLKPRGMRAISVDKKKSRDCSLRWDLERSVTRGRET